MIFGIGTDIVSVARIENALTKHGERFMDRVLSAEEVKAMPETLDLARGLGRFLAKRWAAKEAFAKALGTGIGDTLSFQDITISHDEKGKPIVVASEALKVQLATRNITRMHLSISDEAEFAIAYVVLEH
jgi:holo-[acyl-carrier protein] synthase